MTVDALRRDRLAALSRRLGRKPSATADLYLATSCADLIADGRIERLAPTVFRTEKTLIVLRHDAGVAHSAGAGRRLIWLIDDDAPAGVLDPDLPLWYRLRLALLEARREAALRRAADVIVVPGPAMRARMLARGAPPEAIVEIAPAWPAAQSALPDTTADQPLRVAWLGAASHAADAKRCADILRATLRAVPSLEILWSANHPLPADLARHAGLRTIPAMGWPDYRDWLRGAEFDIGLYPIGASGFNRGRSANKLGEYDQAGAAVLASESWQDAAPAARAGACLLLPQAPDAWAQAIARLYAAPERRHALAAANRFWQKSHDLSKQRALWSALLPETDFTPATIHSRPGSP